MADGDTAAGGGRVLMFQGTSSDVGKSLLVAGLCRAYARRGLVVRPFKAQNMSNNAAVAVDGDLPPHPDGTPQRGEIGRAQALQARACYIPPSVDLNPVLLKPQAEVGSQVVLRGRSLGTRMPRDYHAMRQDLLPVILNSLRGLRATADVVLVEGAGSGAEIYLRDSDISNMRLAEKADLPVVMVTDNDRGGATAAMVGSHDLLDPADRARVQGYLVNKFRGDVSIFQPAMDIMTERTGWPCLGVLRWFYEAGRLPAEDSLALERAAESGGGDLTIAVPRLSRIANFDDLDPLSAEPGVDLRFVQPGAPIPKDADVVILPGSKATRSDLDLLRRQGWDTDIHAHVRHGGRVLGICGGYQMLGRVVRDPQGVEGAPGETPGLGLLDIETEIGAEKRLHDVETTETGSGSRITGYEMHMGCTTGPGLDRPWLSLADGGGPSRPEGSVSADGRVMGTYLHGLFGSDSFRAHWLHQVGGRAAQLDFEARVEGALDALADHCETHLDLDALLRCAR